MTTRASYGTESNDQSLMRCSRGVILQQLLMSATTSTTTTSGLCGDDTAAANRQGLVRRAAVVELLFPSGGILVGNNVPIGTLSPDPCDTPPLRGAPSSSSSSSSQQQQGLMIGGAGGSTLGVPSHQSTESISEEVTIALASEYDTLTHLVARRDANALGRYILAAIGQEEEEEQHEEEVDGNGDGHVMVPRTRPGNIDNNHAEDMQPESVRPSSFPAQSGQGRQSNNDDDDEDEDHSVEGSDPGDHHNSNDGGNDTGSTLPSSRKRRYHKARIRRSKRIRWNKPIVERRSRSNRRATRQNTKITSVVTPRARRSSSTVLDHYPKVQPEAKYDQDHCGYTKGTILAIQWSDGHYFEAVFRGYHKKTRTNVLNHIPKINKAVGSSSGGSSDVNSSISNNNSYPTAVGKGGKKPGPNVETNVRERVGPRRMKDEEEGEESANIVTPLPNTTTTTTRRRRSQGKEEEIWAHVTHLFNDAAAVVNLARMNYFVVDNDEIRLDQNDHPDNDVDQEDGQLIKEEETDDDVNGDDDNPSHPPQKATCNGGGDYQLGDLVAIQWKDGNQYMGTITKIRKSDSNYFYVEYDDDDACWHNYQDLCSNPTRHTESQIIIFPQGFHDDNDDDDVNKDDNENDDAVVNNDNHDEGEED